MALKDDEYEGVMYLNIYQGKIAVVAKEGDEGAVPRVNKNGKTVYEIPKKSVEGELYNITIEDTDYGQMCYMHLQDMDEKYKLAFPVKGDYFSSLAKKQQNIDVNSRMTISPYSFTDKDNPNRTISGLNIYQNGNKVENFITKDNPLDGPRLSDKPNADEKDQFKLDIVRFYKKQVNAFMERLKASAPKKFSLDEYKNPPVTGAEDYSTPQVNFGTEPIPESDLPF